MNISHLILHTALHSANCTLHTAHCTLHTAHCTLLTVEYTLPTAHCTLQNAHCTAEPKASYALFVIQAGGREPCHAIISHIDTGRDLRIFQMNYLEAFIVQYSQGIYTC